MTASERRSGMLIPLFSVPSDTSWGIGDIGDLSHVMSWLAAAGQRVLQLLPINEMAPGQQSPLPEGQGGPLPPSPLTAPLGC